jgi:hypothetical protein
VVAIPLKTHTELHSGASIKIKRINIHGYKHRVIHLASYN